MEVLFWEKSGQKQEVFLFYYGLRTSISEKAYNPQWYKDQLFEKELGMRSSVANMGWQRTDLDKLSDMYFEWFSKINLREREECSLDFIKDLFKSHLA